MATSRKPKRKANRTPSEVNLVSARSAAYSDATSLSRESSADNYARLRARRRRSRVITTVVTVVLTAALLGVGTAFAAYKMVLEPRWDSQLATASDGSRTDFNSGIYEGLFTPPEDPMDPFYILLMGVDNEGINDLPRSDTLILAYIDPGQRKVALISIPRDLRVLLPGYGYQKINAAYAWGESERINFEAGLRQTTNSGPAFAISTVSELAGVDIAYFAVVDFNGFRGLVDTLGGVYVDVPVRIQDREAGPSVIEVGPQVLNGEQALTFVRSRNFAMGDYQRQANQRTFLQALAKQILSDPSNIVSAIEKVTAMTYSNISMSEIINLAMAFQGINESDILTYTTPAYSQNIDGISYELLRETNWRNMISAISAGEFPDPADVGLSSEHQGVTPNSYKQGSASSDTPGGMLEPEQRAVFVVDVRNGWGVTGAAMAVSDQLGIAGYQQGQVANTNSQVYQQTLIIYGEEATRPAAEDIALLLGYGRVISNQGGYTFSGDVLVVVGEDFPHR